MQANTSIMKGYFSSCKYLEDVCAKCRSASGAKITTVSGKQYKVIFSQKYGDTRYYFLPVDANENSLFSSSFISECEIEKFADCFPAVKPSSMSDLLHAYSITEPLGSMLPSELMPKYNADYIDLLYAFLNAVSEL